MTSKENDWTPLYLSCIAGASTSIGAAVVFCQPKDSRTSRRIVPQGTMAFSLSLAGSVMVTVSVISILPEVFMDGDEDDEENYKMIPLFSMDMFSRLCFIALGAVLYFLLSWCLIVPEPEDFLHSNNLDVVLGNMQEVNKEQNEEGKSDEAALITQIQPNNESVASVGSDDNNLHYRRKRDAASPSTLVVTCETSEKISKPSTRQMTLCPCIGQNKNNDSNDSLMTYWTTGKDLESKEQRKAWRVAVLMFVSLLVHNFPEGLAVAASALESDKLGITVTIGIMIHNIPEGIAIAIPCLAARPDQPWLSFALASISGLAEPMGAFVALLFLRNVETTETSEAVFFNLENVLAFVAGIMVMVALWELFPEAREHSHGAESFFWLGTVSGIIIMVLTELYIP